jgi:molecular chaperone GrpE
VTEKPEVAAGGGQDLTAASERIVIRDKRKVGKASDPPPPPPPAEAPEGSEAAEAAEAEAVEATDVVVEDAAPVEAGPVEDVPAVEVTIEEEAVTESVPGSAELGELRSTLDERTADLQRVTAEYANYRKRVERDRTVSAENAVGMVLAALLPVLDDIDRARDHGDLTGPFASVAEQLNTVVTKLGLTAFGSKGDAFDPKLHEAVAHLTSAEVTEPTCIDVMRRGYLLGERLLRPAMVAVADPEE